MACLWAACLSSLIVSCVASCYALYAMLEPNQALEQTHFARTVLASTQRWRSLSRVSPACIWLLLLLTPCLPPSLQGAPRGWADV